MNTTAILKNIATHISLEQNEIDFFISLLQEKEIRKKEFILQANQRCDYLDFVNAGTLRAFYSNQDGKESTVMFAINNWWITDMNCFMNSQPAMLHIVAVENSSILRLSKNNFEKLLLEIPKFEKFFRIIFQKAYIREQLRVLENLSLTAQIRYENFQKKYPQIVQQVTQKQIASYLGITPEFLSAIRRKATK